MNATQHPTIIVSGASSGIGLAAAIWLAVHEARLVLVARRADRLNQAASSLQQLGARAICQPGDIAHPDTSARAVSAARSEFGRVDGLINNAGTVMPLGPIADLAPEDWQNSLAVNLSGPVFLIQAALPDLRATGGRIINVSSGAAQHAIPGAAVYCAAKAGLNQLTHVLAEEEPALTVVAVRPGVVDTDMQKKLRRHGPNHLPAEHAHYYQQLKNQGNLLHATRPARTIAWLAMQAPSQLSGRFVNHDDPEIEPLARLAMQKEALARETYDRLSGEV